MRFPTVGRRRQGKMTVTAFDGGLNRRDLPAAVAENQLTDCENFWWKNGMLCSRPAVRATQTEAVGGRVTVSGARLNRVQEGRLTVGTLSSDGTAVFNRESYACDTAPLRVDFDVQTLEEFTEKGDGTLFFTAEGEPVAPLESGGYLSLAEYVYVPQVLAGGRGAASLFDAPPAFEMYEQPNRLTTRFRASYTTDSNGKFFYLPLRRDSQKPLTAQLTNSSGVTVVHTVPAGDTQEEAAGRDGYRLEYYPTRNAVGFVKEKNAEPVESAGISDNLTLTADSIQSEAASIGRMRLFCWYGGAGGVYGGTRLFLAGDPQNPHRLCWSDCNRPLYFPHDQYCRVGTGDQAITALARQGDQLIVFKEHEIYAADYESNAQTAGLCFTLSPVSDGVGCQSPHSVRLCRNRLVFLSDRAQVCTLISGNAYRRGNVRLLSGMVDTELQKAAQSEREAAAAACLDGYYLLLLGETLWLFRYEDTVFESLSGYSTSDEMAQRGLSWFRWRFPVALCPQTLIQAGGTVGVLSGEGIVHTLGGTVDCVAEDGVATSRPIEGVLETGACAFGYPDRYKEIGETVLEWGAPEDCRMTVYYRTEQGIFQDCRTFATAARDSRDSAFLQVCRLTPHRARVRRLSLRVAVSGAAAFGSWMVRYAVANQTVRGSVYGGEI